MSFKPVPLFIIDSTFRQPDGEYTGTFDIITRERYEEGVKVIADVKPYGGNFPQRDEAAKYAKLFAAAPDMLEVLQSIIGDIFEHVSPDDYKKCKIAIEKATL